MNYRITSDLHFWHSNILNFEKMKRFRGDMYKSVEEMNEDIIRKFNAGVQKGTTTFILGDVCFGRGKQVISRLDNILDQLLGDIILIRGNHDNREATNVFKIYGHKVHEYYEIDDYETKICMSHYPFGAWNKGHFGSVMLHGHSHGSYHAPGRILDVGWDVHGRVLGLSEAYEMAMAKEIYTADHH